MPTTMTDTAGFDSQKARRYLLQRGFKLEQVIRFCYRPFDYRWLYWEPEASLLDRPREEYLPHVFEGNMWIEARQRQPMEHFDRGYVTCLLADNFGNGLSNFFPLYLLDGKATEGLFARIPKPAISKFNISNGLDKYLQSVHGTPTDFFFHCVAVLHCSAYRSGNAGALRVDWPRVPLPASEQMLTQSAELGREVAALLDADSGVAAVTQGKIRSELTLMAVVSRSSGGSLNPDAGDLDLTAGWGHFGKGGAVMPARGKVAERDYAARERAAIAEGAATLGLPSERAFELLGARTLDVYLNNIAYWGNVPCCVWEYTIGGYQVIKKWLSYREREILGRGLTTDEVHAVTAIARRIAGILLLEPKLDANYERIIGSTYQWPGLKEAII
jgi:hypothetical protein